VASSGARAQSNGGGGVLNMTRGAALFDAVAISDTFAEVCAGRGGDASRADAQWGRVSADGVRGRFARGHDRFGCAQNGRGGVVRMGGGVVTFKGGTISNSKAVRAHQLRWHVPRRMVKCSCFLHSACCVVRATSWACRAVRVTRCARAVAFCNTLHVACCALRHADRWRARYVACAVCHVVYFVWCTLHAAGVEHV
jgi:hypothetical protein